jgi:cell wall-associated NlpC family hydrolase
MFYHLLSPCLLLLPMLAGIALASPATAAPFGKKAPARQKAEVLPHTIAVSYPTSSEQALWTPPPPPPMPFEGYTYARSDSPRRSGFGFGSDQPSEEMKQLIEVIRARADHISKFGLPYKFGGDTLEEGGMDCSGTMLYLFSEIGFSDMPRTSFDQYDWLRRNRTMEHTKTIPEKMGGKRGIKPGDLIFWGGTYDSGHKVSHVMVYLGQSPNGTHYMFGARGQKKRGLNGSGVDVFTLEPGYQKSLIGYGSLPGVS